MRIVLLGTGTNVGKTYVAAALASALRRTAPDRPVLALKPVETGVANGVAADANTLEAAAPSPHYPKPHPLYTFEPPISPHLAARRVGVRIELERIAAWVASAERAVTGDCITLIETAGGAFSPVNERTTNLDLAVALEPALWLLVVPDALGALHDTRATLLALERCARLPDHVVVNAAREPDETTGTTAEELFRLGIAEPRLSVPRSEPAAVTPLARTIINIA
jgi:dethiobiotin synthetase